MPKVFFLVLISFCVSGLAIFYGLHQAGAADATLASLQRSNDSLTKVLGVTLQRADSLQRNAAREKAVADSFQALVAVATVKIVAVEHQRTKLQNYIKQLPDTGVAHRFKDLLR